MSIRIGIVGAPNKGKSTFFAALTKIKVDIGPYPFTTIDPNVGIAYLPVECVCNELGVRCSSKYCDGKIRYVPIELIDVAGLVEGAYLGRGMGNKFLNELIKADGFIQIIDASGQTDLDGKPAIDFPLEKEVFFLEKELLEWFKEKISMAYVKFKLKTINHAQRELSGLKISLAELQQACKKLSINEQRIEIEQDKMEMFVKELLAQRPILIAANKADKPGVLDRIKNFQSKTFIELVPTSSEYEYTLMLAKEKGYIEYKPGGNNFKIVSTIEPEKKEALKKIEEFIKLNNGSGVYTVLKKLVFEKMKMIIAYPVEDENKFTDTKNQILPDAILIKQGTNVIEFASKIHTDLAENFVMAIDVKTKKNISKQYIIKNNDVIKIIALKKTKGV